MNEFVDRLPGSFLEPSLLQPSREGLEFDQPAMTRYLHGEISPGYNFFSKAAKADVDTNWLLTGRTVKKQPETRHSAISNPVSTRYPAEEPGMQE
jgi:hypothetical protein